MLELLGYVVAVPVVLYVGWLMVRRRPGQTETERQLEDQSRELRKLKREQERQRWA